MEETILYHVEQQIAIITINRPDYRNAFGQTTYTEIQVAMKKASEDDSVRAIIITGAGNHFCAGGDVNYFNELLENNTPIREEDVLLTGSMIKSIIQNKKVVIAAINGVAAGAGLGLALACDFLIMGHSSRLLTAFINMAFPGDTGLLYLMERNLGTFATKRHVMLGEPIDSRLAKTYGLIKESVPDEEVYEAALTLAQQIAAGPIETYESQKRLFSSILYPDIDLFNQKEAKEMHMASKHSNHYNAVKTFLNKEN